MKKTNLNRNALVNKQSGFTLLEILVALVLGVAILTSAITMQIQHRKGFSLTSNKLEMQTNAKFALEIIGQSLRSAGAMGCKNSKSLMIGSENQSGDCFGAVCINMADKTAAFADFRPGREVLGYESIGAGTMPALPNAFTFVTNGEFNSNSDVLSVSGGFGDVYNVVKDKTIAVTDSGFELDIVGSGGPSVAVNLTQNQFGMLTSCKGAKVFQVVSNNVQIAAGNIQWAGQLGTESGTVASGNDREFRRAAVVSYYVGDFMPPGDNPVAIPTLFQDVDGISQRLIEGIEEIHFLYGFSDPLSRDRNIADHYATADNIGDWADVVSVRIGLIMRSPQPVFENDQTQNISLACVNGYVQATKTDRYARSTYCSEISLRNRLIGSRTGEKVSI